MRLKNMMPVVQPGKNLAFKEYYVSISNVHHGLLKDAMNFHNLNYHTLLRILM